MKPAGPSTHPEVSVEAVARSLLTQCDPAAVGGQPTPEPANGAEPVPDGTNRLIEDDSAARARRRPRSRHWVVTAIRENQGFTPTGTYGVAHIA